MLQRYSPQVWMQRLTRAGFDAARLGSELPARLRRILTDLEQGRLRIAIGPESFEPSLARVERLVNRLILGILAAAFIIGMATLLAVYRPPGWDVLAGIVFAFGLLIAIALGLYLAWSILRSGRR
jgi:ubiquinone biosynthesis protein